jgi:hypothetical protein
LPQTDQGLIVLWNDGGAYIGFFRSMFEQWAPKSLLAVERASPTRVGRGTTTNAINDDLLNALTTAYREARKGPTWGL